MKGMAARVTGILLLGLAAASACGPDFRADVFVRAHRPDLPDDYPKGKLGLLQPTFARADLLLAYRYLSGGSLDAQEQKGWAPTYDEDEPEWGQGNSEFATDEYYSRSVAPATPLAEWIEERSHSPEAPTEVASQIRMLRMPLASGGNYEVFYVNCGEDAFRTAVFTLQHRKSLWGADS